MTEFALAAVGGAAVVVLLACSAFFSSAETAIFSLPVEWVDGQSGGGDRRALTVARPLSLVERVLSPLIAVFDAVTRRIARRIGGESGIERPYLD